ncbi:hypothetical protein ACIOC2_14590 [Streptomyces sp. NPDC088337]|uniref:hypothetical protein n=1 Tax=unclassified Streptomyces TaxID=2593676 RepID=UPI002DD8FFFC|nr:hypothetical protein [Streptomyces sp. NBC_01788]WSB25553.1 hypothetical protein OIE49_06505 [Streptomyces sp. NBC_01788]
MPATDQAIPVLDAFLDGDVNVAALDAWCTEKITVQLGGLTIEVLASTSMATTYVQRLFMPPSDLWNVVRPDAAATGSSATMRALALPRARVAALAERVRSTGTGAPRHVRMHVGAPAAWHPMPGGPVLLTDPDAGIAPQLIVRHPGNFTVITCDDTDATMNAARHLREIGYRRAEDDGWVCLHASAATMDGRGILVVGDSGAGKSTLALALAATAKGAFLSNDRTMITAFPGAAPQAVAMPGPIRLNGGTLQALGYASAEQWDLTRPQSTMNTDWQNFRGSNKLHILPSEWHERTGTPLATTATVDLVVFPQVIQDSQELHLQAMRPESARELLGAQRMSPGDNIYVSDWLGIRTSSPDALARNGARVVDALASQPAVSLRFGTRVPYAAVTETVRAAFSSPASSR